MMLVLVGIGMLLTMAGLLRLAFYMTDKYP